MALDSESAMEESKGDWDCIIENLEGPMSTRFSSFIDTALEKIDDMIPCCVFHSELHYLINIKRMETQFHLCAAYATAHELPQIKLARFFGDDSTANTAEECVVSRIRSSTFTLSQIFYSFTNRFLPPFLPHIHPAYHRKREKGSHSSLLSSRY